VVLYWPLGIKLSCIVGRRAISERIIQPCFAGKLDARALIEVRGKRKSEHNIERQFPEMNVQALARRLRISFCLLCRWFCAEGALDCFPKLVSP